MKHTPFNTRREVLATMLGLAVTGCGGGGGGQSGTTVTAVPAPAPIPDPVPAPASPPAPAPAASAASPAGAGSLDAAARLSGRRFGSAVAYDPYDSECGSCANPAYAGLLQNECGLLVAENEMKWQAIAPAPGQTSFERADAIMEYAALQGRAVRGHNLIWHQRRWMPGWTETHDYGASPVREAERILDDRVRAITARYRGRIESWDVINEAVDYQTGELYETAFSQAYGGALPMMDRAFHVARDELPDAQLVYNDFMSWDGNAVHRAQVLKLLEGFKVRGVPVDALGIQSHIGIYHDVSLATQAGWYTAEWRRFLDEVVAMGYELLITELDVNAPALPADAQLRDRRIADYAQEYLNIMLEYPQLGDILVWGLSDRYTWLEEHQPRADGAPQRPCCYDADFSMKSLRASVLKSFEDATPAA